MFKFCLHDYERVDNKFYKLIDEYFKELGFTKIEESFIPRHYIKGDIKISSVNFWDSERMTKVCLKCGKIKNGITKEYVKELIDEKIKVMLDNKKRKEKAEQILNGYL